MFVSVLQTCVTSNEILLLPPFIASNRKALKHVLFIYQADQTLFVIKIRATPDLRWSDGNLHRIMHTFAWKVARQGIQYDV